MNNVTELTNGIDFNEDELFYRRILHKLPIEGQTFEYKDGILQWNMYTTGNHPIVYDVAIRCLPAKMYGVYRVMSLWTCPSIVYNEYPVKIGEHEGKVNFLKTYDLAFETYKTGELQNLYSLNEDPEDTVDAVIVSPETRKVLGVVQVWEDEHRYGLVPVFISPTEFEMYELVQLFPPKN